MRRFGRRNVHRSLACVVTAPLAVFAGLYLLDAETRSAAPGSGASAFRAWSGLGARSPGSGGGAGDPRSDGDGAAATASGSAAEAGAADPRSPDSQVIGDGRSRGPGGPGAGPGDGPGRTGGGGAGAGGTSSRQIGAKTGPTLTTTTVTPANVTTALDGTSGGPAGSQPPRVEDLPPGTGLLGQYWDHDSELTTIPNLDISGADITRVDPLIFFEADGWNLPFKPLETWATCWRGYLKVLVEGHYAFVLGSDDGALLEIDNKVVCGQDRLQGYFESRGETDLAKGLHVVKLRYFNNRGPGLCKLFWTPPGAGDRAVVPTDVLYPAGGAAEVGRPTITSITPDGAKRGDKIIIIGTNFSDIPTLDKVTFGPSNVPAVVQDATATRLTVIVPNGVDQGPIALKVGDLTAPAVPYNVGGFFGLYARTWIDRTTDKDVATFMDGTTQAVPDDEQLVGPLDVRTPGAFNLPFATVRFRTCYTGRFWAQAAGQHGFALESDDGSRLIIDGQLVVDDSGLHGRKHVDGQIFLSAGWHDIEVDFFQNQGDANVTLFHADPDGKLGVCPRALLAPPAEMDLRVTPAINTLNPNPAKAGDRLLITGAGLTAPDGRNPVVTLNGRTLSVVAASPGSVAVEVPFGYDSGPLVVRAGPLSTPPVALQVTGYGLKAEFWQFNQQVTSMPAFDTAPNLTRTDDQVDYQEDPAFKVPWEPDHFAAQWTGKLYVPTDGTYELATGSDDGSVLLLDGQKVVDNDGLHGYQEVGSPVKLSAGLHTIVLRFFENEGEARCRLLWKPPGAGGRSAIPRGNLILAD